MRASLQADCSNSVAFCQKFRYNTSITQKNMKNLSQFPRKISAKFCYELEFNDHFEDETVVPKLQENNDKTEAPKNQISKPSFTAEEIRAAEEADKEALLAAQKEVDDLLNSDSEIARAANNDPNFREAVKAEENIPKSQKPGIFATISNFFAGNKEFNKTMGDVSRELADLDPKTNKNMVSIMGSSQVEDYDIAA